MNVTYHISVKYFLSDQEHTVLMLFLSCVYRNDKESTLYTTDNKDK